jgi:hypothetical protein
MVNEGGGNGGKGAKEIGSDSTESSSYSIANKQKGEVQYIPR